MSFYLIAYTAAHLVGAVSLPMNLTGCAFSEDNWNGSMHDYDRRYTFVCEEHDKPPKVQVKPTASDRKFLHQSCIQLGLPMQCDDLPNGDINYLTTARDKHGNRIVRIIKKKDVPPQDFNFSGK